MIDRDDNIVDLNAILHPGSVYNHPRESLVGWMILASGIPVYLYWRQLGRKG